MTKLSFAALAGVLALSVIGVAACGQSTNVETPPAAQAPAEPAAAIPEAPPADAIQSATDATGEMESPSAPVEPAPAPSETTTPAH